VKVTRRQFAGFIGVATAACGSGAGEIEATGGGVREIGTLVEQRVYDCAGVVPPDSVLRRCGIAKFERHAGERHVEYRIEFDSLAERTRAWDRFNCDPEWCALRAGGDVRLKEISFS
jgi:hypothetical protein